MCIRDSDSPTFPLANSIFRSPYWDREATEGMRKLFKLEHGNFEDFLYMIFQFLIGHPVSLLLVATTLIWCIHYKNIGKFPTPLIHFLLILSFSWVGGLILWIIFLNPQVYPRFIIGFVFLTILLPVTIAIFALRRIFLQNHQRWQKAISGIALLLTVSVSHTDVDFQQAKHWISSESFHRHSSFALGELYIHIQKLLRD